MEGLGFRSGGQRNRIMKEEKEVKQVLSLLDTISDQSSQDTLRNYKELALGLSHSRIVDLSLNTNGHFLALEDVQWD